MCVDSWDIGAETIPIVLAVQLLSSWFEFRSKNIIEKTKAKLGELDIMHETKLGLKSDIPFYDE